MNGNLTGLQRFFLAFVAFFLVLFDRTFAQQVQLVRERRSLPPAGPTPAPDVGVRPDRPVESTSAPPTEVGVVPPAVTIPPPALTPPPSRTPAAVAPQPRVGPPPPPVAAPAAAPVAAPAPAPVAAPAAAPAPAGPAPEVVALHVLGTLQRDGRLVDFLSEDLTGFSDSEIGAAARTVHEGCRKTLASYVALEPIYREPEGATVTVAAGFDPATIRITGNVVGDPPFRGRLQHHGWRATRATFPPIAAGHDPRVVAPAEVELA